MFDYIKKSNKGFVEHINGLGGWDFFFKASTAKILWLVILYRISSYIASDVSYLFVRILIVWGVISWIWKSIFSKHSPKWIEELATGEIFFGIDKNKINKYIYVLLLVNISLLVWPFLPKHIQLKRTSKTS